jgi:hypothetical protein
MAGEPFRQPGARMSSPARAVEPERESARSPEAPPAPRAPFFSGPLFGILIGNAVTLVAATVQHWPALSIMLVYWGQSVALGIANVIRMLMLEDFSTDGFTSGGHRVPATRAGQVSTARFFAFHYGFFHLGYALFLFGGKLGRIERESAMMIAANIAMFAGSHIWHVVAAGGSGYRRKPNLGTLMFYPYLRIIPMHIAIILGSAFPPVMLPLFMALKTAADLGMHEVECRMLLISAD